ncbi:MAG: transposase [Bacteroidetes bacterium]|nr:MAG: transposase [Bacteroidota bacterium]
MKKILPICLVALYLIVGCKPNASVEEQTPSSTNMVTGLFERKGALANADEWAKTKAKVAELQLKIAAKPTDVKPMLQLAVIYISEARITGEHPYYYPAIISILDRVIAIEPANFEALVLKSSVKMSQHQFAEGKQLAEKAKVINPDNAYVYGILVDANVELGDYKAAVMHSDKMQSLKPSLESYARASYLREIYGDYKGAIAAMQLAVDAGLPGSEPYCWAATTLAELYVKTGQLDKAAAASQKVLAMRPSYAFAMCRLAEAELERKNYPVALALLDSAAAILPEFSFHERMADLYAAQGDTSKALLKYADVARMLNEDEHSGHTVALEKAKLYVKMNALDSATKYVQIELNKRPNNIDVNKTMAEISLLQKNAAAAKKHLALAQSTGNRDPELLALAKAIGKI